MSLLEFSDVTLYTCGHTLFNSEQFALHQILGNGRAVDSHKRAPSPRAIVV